MTKHWTVLVIASQVTLLALFAPTPVARADIFQWEYINPADPSQGKQQGTMLCPDGAGVDAVSGAILGNRNLTKAYLVGAYLGLSPIFDEYGDLIDFIAAANLTGANLSQADLSNSGFLGGTLDNVNLSQASLTNAYFYLATLTGANLSQADLTHASFSAYGFYGADAPGANLSQTNLSQTNLANANFAGYREYDFSYGYIITPGANLTGANLSGADARGARFEYATLTGANTSNLIQSDGHIAGLNLVAGETLVAYAGVPIPVHVSGGFSIDPSATLDLNDNDLIVRATAETKDALHAAVQAKIVSAQNGLDANFITKWDGPGVTSTSARTANVASGFDLVGLGVIRNSDIDTITGLPGSSYTSFSGKPVTADDVLVKYTYIGDGNLDGLVSFDDYVGMDNAFFGLVPNLGWATGDINFDGVINFDDYTVVDQAFFFQGAPLSNDANFTTVPEPATALFLPLSLLATIAMMRYFPANRARSPKNPG